MPIIVKDVHWSQTDTNIYIQIPLKGVKQKNVDISCNRELIKVHYPPYLFEALLYQPINDVHSSAVIKDNYVKMSLVKISKGNWEQFLSPRSDDKQFLMKKKVEALEEERKKVEKEMNKKKTEKNQNKKYAISEMMKLEQMDKKRIEEIKNSERQRSMQELEEWKLIKQQEAEQEKILSIHRDAENSQTVISSVNKITNSQQHHPREQLEEVVTERDEKEKITTAKDDSLSASKSFPRKSTKITVKFTPRIFPTPIRESKIEEETEWLEKQAKARKSFLLNEEDLTEKEKDPEWLKAKASQLFSTGDIKGAVNAYTLAIRIQPNMALLYTNRAACHLRLRNLYKCVEDCSKALDLLHPVVDANAKLRLKSHLRRATAFCELEMYVEGLLDYEAAIKIDPQNKSLLVDAQNIRNIIQSG